MRILYMYHAKDPLHGSIIPGSLPNPQLAYKGYVPLTLTQRFHDETRTIASSAGANKVNTIHLRNNNVKLPMHDDTLFWCKVFELKDFHQKHHIIKVSSIFSDIKILSII